MGYEIDFLPVGDGSKSGDAIALRYGNLYGQRNEQTVIVIDAGSDEAAGLLVEHIQGYYGTNYVDYVISTHADADHCSGLTKVVNELGVGALFMHKPWDYSDSILNLFKNTRLTGPGLEQIIRKSLRHAKDLEKLAVSKNIPIYEPFSGMGLENGTMIFLGPSQEYYCTLVSDFRETPEPSDLVKQVLDLIKQGAEGIAEEVQNWLEETLHIETETLDKVHKNTSAENSSSAITLFNIEGRQLLFTADAGVDAIKRALDFANSSLIDLTNLRFIQVPHHGSKHNINAEILDSLPPCTAMISAAKEGDPLHPSRRVVNALIRRGYKPLATQGIGKLHHYSSPDRPGWSAAAPLQFYSRVEN